MMAQSFPPPILGLWVKGTGRRETTQGGTEQEGPQDSEEKCQVWRGPGRWRKEAWVPCGPLASAQGGRDWPEEVAPGPCGQPLDLASVVAAAQRRAWQMLGAYYSLNGQREGPESRNLMALEG